MRIIPTPAHRWKILKPAQFRGGLEDQHIPVAYFEASLFRFLYYRALTKANGRLDLLRIQKAHQEIERLVEVALESSRDGSESMAVVTHPVMEFQESYIDMRKNFLSERLQKKLADSHVIRIAHFEDGLVVFVEQRTHLHQQLCALSFSSESMDASFQEALDQATRTLVHAAS